MVFDIGSTSVPWPGLVIAISAGSIICTVLLLVMCTCCFKTKVPQYRAKLTKNVVAKEDIRRYSPDKRKFGQRENRMHSLIFDGAPIGSGRWDDLFVTGDETIPNEFKRENHTSTHANPPDVIMHPALLRVLNKESRNITQREALIVATSSVTSPSRPSHPSSNLEELIRQSEDAETEKPNGDGTPLARFPIQREPSQEFNRDGSILYYKPRRDPTPSKESKPPTPASRDQTRFDDPVTSRIQEVKQRRKSQYTEPFKSPKLPRFNRTSGEWDNVPKPGRSVDTPPPVPSRNYSIVESDVATDCSETMPRPVKDKTTEAERTKLDVIRESTRQSARLSSRSSDASRNLPRSPDTDRLKRSKVKNPSPISDTVFIPNENPAYSHGLATPPGHTPRKDYRRRPDDRVINNRDEYHLSVMSDGSFDLVDETRRQNHRPKRVGDLISDHHSQSPPRQFKPGVYYRLKPHYHQLKVPEKRYSDASDYSDVMFERTNSIAKKPGVDDPYFFRSRWSSAFETRHTERVRGHTDSESRDMELRKKRLSHMSSSNESSPDRQVRNNQRLSSQRSSRSNRSSRQSIPLPEAPFPYTSRAQHRDVSPSKRNRDRRSQQPQPLDVVIEQHKDDVLVSPGHQPNYPVDVAKIRRGLQQSSLDKKSKEYPQQRAHYDVIVDENSNISKSVTSLHVPDNHNIKRASSDYGSLIDILYTYRQSVRQSRVKERPAESPESRLKYEREKLKTKLREVLEPREMKSKNVDMVVETLLFLCETESGRDKKKQTWQRDVFSDTNAQSQCSNFIKTATPTEDDANVGDYDVTNNDDYARIRSHSESRSSLVKHGGNSTEKLPPQNSPNFNLDRPVTCNQSSVSCDFTMPLSASSESAEKECAFPTVEELNRILGQEGAPPPVPHRRHQIISSDDVIPPPVPQRRHQIISSDDVIPPPVAPRKSKSPYKPLPPPPDENIPNGKIENFERYNIPNGKNSERNISEQKLDSNEPDYAKIRKKSRKRRKSLPSRHLTESEINWLKNSGGDAEKLSNVPKFSHVNNIQNFPRENNRIASESVRARERTGAFLSARHLPSPPAPPREGRAATEATISLDDIAVDETTDAEDIIKAVERKMSQNQNILSRNDADQSPAKNGGNSKVQSDSEMGTWSSVTSSEIPVPPRRGRLHRSDGMSPNRNEATSESPVFLRKTYQITPPSGKNRPRDPIAGALSPLRTVRGFQTPPASPQINFLKASPRKFTSSNPSITPPLTPSPKIKARNSPHLPTPSKQYSVPYRPTSPQPTPKKNPHRMGFMPDLARRSSKMIPNIPVMSKRLIQPTSKHEIVVPIESDRRRISRKGEIIYIPDDNDYALPVDAVTMESSYRFLPSQYPIRGDMSPNSPLFSLESQSFYPIVEEDDYAVPVNQTPNFLMQQRAYARSMEILPSDYESSV